MGSSQSQPGTSWTKSSGGKSSTWKPLDTVPCTHGTRYLGPTALVAKDPLDKVPGTHWYLVSAGHCGHSIMRCPLVHFYQSVNLLKSVNHLQRLQINLHCSNKIDVI